ncbi:TPA: DNA primase [Streptococcus suis]
MGVKEIKSELSRDSSKVEELLSYFGFHTFKLNGNDLRCALPDGDNPSSVSVILNEYLKASCYSRSIYGDIFQLIEDVTDRSFKEILGIVEILFGYDTSNKASIQNKSSLIIEDISSYKRDKRSRVFEPNELYDKSYLDRFIMIPHREIYNEGISPLVVSMFEIGYDEKKSRLIFPHYDWHNTDKLVGVKGRIVGFTSDECKELGISKYWNYIKGYKKLQNLYGWNLAKENVWENKKLIIFEGEKSVLKQFTLERGKGYSVAVGGHDLSMSQIKFIVNNTPSDCEVIFAFDKDIMTNEASKVRFLQLANKMSKYRLTSYICDTIPGNKLLKEKDSPIDATPKIWRYLLSERKKVR